MSRLRGPFVVEELKLEWVREYLHQYFPGQPLSAQESGTAIVIDVTDSHGQLKELRIPPEFFRTYPTKTTIQDYLKNANIAQQIEIVPRSVSIRILL
jgi:hypothetical protein